MNIKKITGYLFFFSIVAIGQVTNQKVIDTNWVIMIEKKIEIDTDRVLAEKLNNILISVCKEKLAKPNLNKSERALYQNSYFLALLNTAYFEELRTNMKKAISINIDVLQLAEKNNNSFIETYANLAIGSIFATLDEFENAKTYFLKALECAKKSKLESATARIYGNLAYVYIKLNDRKKAIELIKKSLTIYEKLKDSNGIATCSMGLANNYFVEKHYPQAREFYNRSIKIFTKKGDLSAIANAYKNLYKVEKASQNDIKAIDYLIKSYELSNVAKNQQEIQATSSLLSLEYKTKKNFRQAFLFMEKSLAAEKIINKESNKNNLLKAEFKYESEKKEAEIKQLSLAKKITELENKRQKTTLLLLILGVVSALITSFLLFKRFKEKKQTELLKFEIEKTSAEKKASESELKALKSQMNPHFIFNALNSIQEQFMYGDKIIANEQMGNFTTLTREILTVSGKKKITIQKEIDLLTKYLELEKMRFDKDFSYQFIVSNEIDEDYHEIPPMILQPFVENSIKHGLLHQTGLKKIKLFFDLDEAHENILCTIEDNGIGREKSADIKTKNNHVSFSTNSIEQRLELLSDSKSDKKMVVYEDVLDENGVCVGTKVQLTIPIV